MRIHTTGFPNLDLGKNYIQQVREEPACALIILIINKIQFSKFEKSKLLRINDTCLHCMNAYSSAIFQMFGAQALTAGSRPAMMGALTP